MPTPPTEGSPPLYGRTPETAGILKSLSIGIRSLLVLEEKLGALGKEGDRARSEIQHLQEHLFRAIGKLEEIDKRFDQIDRFVELKIEIAVRKAMEEIGRI